MSSQNKISFFSNLKTLRKDYLLTLSELSNKIKISVNTLKNYEIVKQFPPHSTLLKLSNFYGVSIDFLLLGEKTNFIKKIKLFELAEKLDEKPLQEMGKVESYIYTFLDNDVVCTKRIDTCSYNFNGNFNNNFKELLKNNNLTSKYMADFLDVSVRQIASFKKETECSYSNLLKLSSKFNVSIHWLITGVPLRFNIGTPKFNDLITKADEYLENDHINTTIKIMEQIIKSCN